MVPEPDHAGLAGSGILPEVHLQARVGGGVGGGVRDGARQPRGGVGELAAAQQLGPLQQGRGDVAVVHEQVSRLLVTVHARVGQAVAEVVEVAVQEDRVVGAPQDESGHVGAAQGGEVLSHPLQFGMAAVAGVGRDVRDEAADAAASGRRVVGQVVGRPGLAVEGRRGEEVVTERKASVVTVEAGRTGPARAACSGAGIGAPSGWWTAVFRVATPATSSG